MLGRRVQCSCKQLSRQIWGSFTSLSQASHIVLQLYNSRSQESDILSTSPFYMSFAALSLCRYVCQCVSLCVILPNRFYPSQNTKLFCVLVPANSLHSCPFTPCLHTPWVTGTGSLVWYLCPCFSWIRSQALEGLSWLGIAWNSLRRMEWEIQSSFSRDPVAKGRAASKAQSTKDAGHGAFSSTERGEDPGNKNAFTSSWKATASEKA